MYEGTMTRAVSITKNFLNKLAHYHPIFLKKCVIHICVSHKCVPHIYVGHYLMVLTRAVSTIKNFSKSQRTTTGKCVIHICVCHICVPHTYMRAP